MVKMKQKIITVVLILILAAAAIVTVSLGVTSARADSNTDTPQITALTHGWGSEAKTWSSKDGLGLDFAQDNDSLLYKLSQKSGGAYIYRAKTEGGDVGNPRYDLYADYGQTKTNINSVSKHIIIVFDSKNSGKTNDVVFSEFKYMLNDVVGKVQNLNSGGRMPKINLIGHSRGGITNLQYALEYPERVHSLISIGTPYFGSEAADKFGSILFPNTGSGRTGLDDITDETIYNGYYQTWTAGYESKYKNINSIAIGGASEVDYQRDVIKAKGGDMSNEFSTLLYCYFDNIFTQKQTVNKLIALYPTLVLAFPELKMFSWEEFTELVVLLDKEIREGIWYSDVLVPVDSQQGFSGDKNYYFSKYVKTFNEKTRL